MLFRPPCCWASPGRCMELSSCVDARCPYGLSESGLFRPVVTSVHGDIDQEASATSRRAVQ
eukprot:13369653-Alexandrium_andersonii.AAC.1